VPILEVQDLTKAYRIASREIRVLDQVSFTVEPGEFVVIKGASGSGKSTLLSLMSGLDSATAGRVVVEGRDITGLSEDELAPLRNETIGFVFQSFHLVPSLNAVENVMFPAELRHFLKPNSMNGSGTPRQRALALLERAGLAHRATNFPHQLSGGERQRVAICRALINEPKILFADEPTGNLDSKNGASVLDLLETLHREQGTTLVLVTHSDEIAARAERVLTLADGRLVSDAPNRPGMQ
jgi:putative ABC transport system ATP-binding protein